MKRSELIGRYPELTMDEVQWLISQKKPHTDISEQITPYNSDAEWKERLKDIWWSKDYKGETEERVRPVLKLRDVLLSLGGCEACLPVIEEDLEHILKYGQLWDNITKTTMKGDRNQCHRNSAELWHNNRGSYKNGHALFICTGYALSADGIWRQHSWLLHAKPRANVLIETTEPRVAYYGFGMDHSIAEEFEYYNF